MCCKQYVGSTVIPFKIRFNNYNYNYKLGDRSCNVGTQIPQPEFFSHFSEEGHSDFLEDSKATIGG